MSCLPFLSNGDILGFIQCPFDQVIGLWVFAIIFLWLGGMIYIRTQSLSALGVLAVMFLSIMISYGAVGPETYPIITIATIIVTLITAAIIFSVYLGRREIQ